MGTSNHRIFACRCSCGEKRKVALYKLTSGLSRSCGCLKKEEFNRRITTHGLSKTPEYVAWSGMKQRCYDKPAPVFAQYGGVGIRMHPLFLGENGFKNFFDYIGAKPSQGHSIDRIDNNKGYEPGNIRWSTKLEQMANRKNTIWITYNGRTKNLADWSRETGIARTTLWARIKRQWDIKRIIEKPVVSSYPRHAE